MPTMLCSNWKVPSVFCGCIGVTAEISQQDLHHIISNTSKEIFGYRLIERGYYISFTQR